MNHLEFAALESASLGSDASWERWVARCERALGHDLNGDEAVDGYSIDGALKAFEAGRSVAQHVAHVREAIAALVLRAGLDALLIEAG